MQNSLTFQNLLDDAAIFSLEHQLHLETVIGNHNWNVNLAEPRFEFSGDSDLVCERFHLLGSAAPGPQSWMWSWANPSGFPAEVSELAASVRDLGHQHGITELMQPEVPFRALPGSPELPHQVLSQLTDAAKVLSGRWFSYNGEVGGGTRAAFLVEHPAFQLPQATPLGVTGILQQAVSGLTAISDHRRAVYSYARLRGLAPEFSDDGRTITLTAFGIEAGFDEHNRLSRIDGGMTPED
ncbi:DUF6882 domain-containing protein [Nocardiopsis oceani]